LLQTVASSWQENWTNAMIDGSGHGSKCLTGIKDDAEFAGLEMAGRNDCQGWNL
jgi:hypothetical protein